MTYLSTPTLRTYLLGPSVALIQLEPYNLSLAADNGAKLKQAATLVTTMASKKPVFVCLPGAAHGAWLFKPLVAELSSAGYRAVPINRPGCRPLDDTKPPQDSMYPDADLACRTIDELLDSGHDIITLCHSYAGTVAGEAVGRVVSNRQEMDGTGKGRILWMVYVGSYPVLENTACFNCGDKIFAALGTPKPAGPGEFPFWDAVVSIRTC